MPDLTFNITGDSRSAQAANRGYASTAELAARGARLAAEAIEKQRRAADKSVDATITLAKADKILADAEKELAGDALLADKALRRQGDAAKDAARKQESAAREIRASFKSVTPGGVLAGLAPAGLALLPRLLAPVAGAAAAVGVSFGAAAAGAGVFGLLAKQNFTIADTAADKVQVAQSNYNIAIAHGTKQAVAYKAEQIAIAKAYANLSPAQVALSKKVSEFSTAWQAVQASTAPLVTGALLPWMNAATKAMSLIKPFVTPVADVFRAWGQTLDRYFSSRTGSSELHRMATEFGRFSALQLNEIVTFIVEMGKGVFALGRDLGASGVNFGAFGAHLVVWGAAFDRWAHSKAARQDVSKFIEYMRANGRGLVSTARDLARFIPGIASGASSAGTLELQAIGTLLSLISKLPPGWAKPITELAGAMLLLSKTGVLKVGVTLVKSGFAWRPATAAAGGTESGFLAGLLGSGKLKWIIRGGVAVAAVAVVVSLLKGTPSGKDKNWFDNPFGLPGPKDPKSANNWLTSWSPYINFVTKDVPLYWSTSITSVEKLWDGMRHSAASVFDHMRHDIAHAWDMTWRDAGIVFDVWKENIRITWDQIKILFLRGELAITTTMGHLPGPLGAPFRAASKSIRGELGKIQGDVRNAAGNITRDWNAIHGKTVPINFTAGFGGVAPGHKVIGQLAAGTAGAAPGWHWVGEKGPELAYMRGGETVLSHPRSMKAIGGYAAGTPGFTDVFRPSAGQWVSRLNARISAAENAFIRAELPAARRKLLSSLAGYPGGGPTGAAQYALEQYAASLFPRFGWGGYEILPLGALWNRESGWNRFARNSSSGAYGIPQALPPTKLPFAGQAAGGSSAAAQIWWGENYIKGRYGTPSGAWAHETAFNWYDRGGLLPPGLSLALNTTGRPEPVIPASSGSRPQKVVLEVRAGPGGDAQLQQFIVRLIKQYVFAVGGGDVEAALGRS